MKERTNWHKEHVPKSRLKSPLTIKVRVYYALDYNVQAKILKQVNSSIQHCAGSVCKCAYHT